MNQFLVIFKNALALVCSKLFVKKVQNFKVKIYQPSALLSLKDNSAESCASAARADSLIWHGPVLHSV